MGHALAGRLVLGIAALALTATGALAQQAKMYGSVVDDKGQPVANAKVILEPIEGGSRVEVITKGKKGGFLIGIIRPGTYRFKVEAAGAVLLSLNARAINLPNKKEAVWTVDGRVRADRPTQMKIEDGMEITCDAVVGQASEVTTATGEKTLATPDQALAMMTQQVQQGNCVGTLPQLEKFVAENPSSGRAFYLQGYCDAVLERDDEALAALAKALELDPSFVGTQTLIGKVLARNKKLAEAEAAFQKELANPAASVDLQVDALLSLGSVQRDQGKDADAVATFEKAKSLVPSRPESYVELSALYAKMGQTDKAAAILDEAKQVGADDPVALLNVGISYMNKKDYAHADGMFRRVIESKAGSADLAMAYGLLGKLQLRDGKTEDAIASLKKCVELDPAGRLAKESEELLSALKK